MADGRPTIKLSGVKPGDTLKIRVTAPTEPSTYRVERDMIVVREDGSVDIVKAGTILTLSEPVAPFETEVTIEQTE